MDDVASRAGVGKAAIYRRWSSKAVVVADAIAHWRRRLGPVEPPNTGSLRGDIEALIAAAPDLNDADSHTIRVVVGVATAAMHDPTLAAALDELVLSTPRQVIRAVLDHAVARGEIPAGRDLSLIPDVALGLSVLRVITGRPTDRVYVRRVLEDVILPLAGASAHNVARFVVGGTLASERNYQFRLEGDGDERDSSSGADRRRGRRRPYSLGIARQARGFVRCWWKNGVRCSSTRRPAT